MSVDLNTTILALQIEQGLKFVGVKFHKECGDFDVAGAIDETEDESGYWGGKVYHYKTTEECEEGDFLVVEARGHLQVVKVVETDVDINLADAQRTKFRWVVANITQSMKDVAEMKKRESTAAKQVTNARLQKEAAEFLSLTGVDKSQLLLIGSNVMTGKMEKDDTVVDSTAGEVSDGDKS